MKSNREIDVNDAQVKNVATPTDSKDAATKGYVDVAVANSGGGTGGGGGTALVSYSAQIEILDDYPDYFPTDTDNIEDMSDEGKAIVTADNPKDYLGISNVDNTSDLAKPISDATQAALDLKANANNPIFTGTVVGVNKSDVGLSDVDNTSDADKPLSTAAQDALDSKQNYIIGNAVAVVKPGGGVWPDDRPTDDTNAIVFCVGESPGPSWMINNDVLMDLTAVNSDIYLMPSDILLPSDDLLVKG